MGRKPRFYGEPWVEKVSGKPEKWRLTDKGREIARFRARQR
jgi:hypothetical protein